MADLSKQISDWLNNAPDEVKSALGKGIAVAAEAGGESSGQQTKAEANYRASETDKETCGNCLHFMSDKNECDLVAGHIKPEAVCDLWEQGAEPEKPKKAKHEPAASTADDTGAASTSDTSPSNSPDIPKDEGATDANTP